MISETQSTPLIAALEQIGPHDHLCSIYENQQDHLSVAIPFIRIGLERREKCIYVADDGTIGDIGKAMQSEGIDVDRATASGALALVTKEDAYLKHGCFDPDRMFNFWKEAAQAAMNEGFSALRTTGETDWVLRKFAGLERWLDYESRLTHTLTESNCFALCQYDRRKLAPEIILKVIRTHPSVIYRGTVSKNLYYVPPDELLSANRAERDVESVLANLNEHEHVESELREKQLDLLQARHTIREQQDELKRTSSTLREKQIEVVEDTNRRKVAEEESSVLKNELAAELEAVTRLHELSTWLLTSTDLQPVLEKLLNATIALQNADFGSVQLYDSQIKALEIVAQRGFQPEFLDDFRTVREDCAVYGRAMQRRERVIIEDVQTDPAFERHREIAASTGFRALQFTPLFDRAGDLLGMLSTYFRQPHHPSERELRATDLYAIQAAQMIERQRAEPALRGSEERFRLLVEGIKDYAIFMLDTDGRVMTWNSGAERIKGYRPEEILGKSYSSFYQQADIEAGKPEQALKMAETAGRFEDEGWQVRKDGSRFWADVVITALRDRAGTLQGFVKITRDTTERKRAEEELRRSEAYLAEGQRLSHTGSWAWNVCSGELFWSDEHFRIFGLDPKTTKPSYPALLKWTHPEDRSMVEETFDAAVRERRDYELDCRVVRPDGIVKHIHSLGHPVFNPSGDLQEYVGTVIDTTEQHQARAELAQAFEEINVLKNRLHEENVVLREEIDQRSMFEEIIGSSRAVKSVLSRVTKVAPMDCTVLITGETGTGKELIARAIHKRSNRAGRAFIGFNCAGIPPSLIASELFGHEKGAFTGAQQRRLGRFELAEGGTIFLDEVGELPAETQIALLRVIQEHEFERVGGSQPIATDVRVIAATNRDLQAAVAAGSFRLDLFYRLNVFPIEVPPLHERKEDISMLLEYFIKRYADKTGKKMRSIDKRTVELFKSYNWPGNIRELQNVIERSVIVCESDSFSVDPSWLSTAPVSPSSSASTLAEKLHEQETKIIEAALAESKGRIAGRLGAASKLGIPSSTLESRIKLLKIKKNRFKAD